VNCEEHWRVGMSDVDVELVDQSFLYCLLQVFSYFHAQYTFFHQGFDLLRDLEPTMKSMAAQVRRQ
jgi:hypothetical protein